MTALERDYIKRVARQMREQAREINMLTWAEGVDHLRARHARELDLLKQRYAEDVAYLERGEAA